MLLSHNPIIATDIGELKAETPVCNRGSLVGKPGKNQKEERRRTSEKQDLNNLNSQPVDSSLHRIVLWKGITWK